MFTRGSDALLDACHIRKNRCWSGPGHICVWHVCHHNLIILRSNQKRKRHASHIYYYVTIRECGMHSAPFVHSSRVPNKFMASIFRACSVSKLICRIVREIILRNKLLRFCAVSAYTVRIRNKFFVGWSVQWRARNYIFEMDLQ